MPDRDDDDRASSIAEIQVSSVDQNLALDAVKVTVDNKASDVDGSPMVESTRGPSISTTADHTSDGASTHSMPAVHITEPTSPAVTRPSPISSSQTTLLSARPPPPSPSRSSTFHDEGTTIATSQQRRARHRSAIEPRSSNRLSGFFTNLIHRRDHPAPSSREAIREDPQSEPAHLNSEAASRSSSPIPPRPASPPPPSLPAPTLQELGLSLSALTSELAPSHFTTPPSSGAFLAPHYLLLCHAQGLDVLPLVSPPALQPYALVRRVSFKSVVVMEQRGVLVAIAGRRDGVRVYALEEVKKAIEWRIDVEVRRERDRIRRENVKKMTLRPVELPDARDSAEKQRKASLSTPPPGESDRVRANLLRKNSTSALPTPAPAPPSPPPVPLVPRSATRQTPKKKPRNPTIQIPTETPPVPAGLPPPYASPADAVSTQPSLQNRPSFVSLGARARGNSVSNVLATPPSHRTTEASRREDDSKADWAESSDEEAIDAVASGPSGTYLDERTSATLSSSSGRTVSSPHIQPHVPQSVPVPVLSRNSTEVPPGRRRRPSNLDLSLTRTLTIPPPEPSPAPTLINLRQTLTHTPSSHPDETPSAITPAVEGDDDDEEIDGHISLAQALLESRIPDLPPVGTRRPQEPILITPSNSAARLTPEPSSPSDNYGSIGRNNSTTGSNRRRRRWSIMIGSPTTESANDPPPPVTAPNTGRPVNRFSRSSSFRSNHSTHTLRSATEPLPATAVPALPEPPSSAAIPVSSRSARFLPRIINNVLHGRGVSVERSPAPTSSPVDGHDGLKWTPGAQQTPPPKLEYVKLPGTKGALLVKSVETAKKSFLAILCGDNGEKVELFAGTYRTALGLSRTFILPDSPRSLELQLQGDDLVEVFLVFAQNVFGLEPATVRVREVRIGRAERRAARRRARENRIGGSDAAANDADALDDETNVNVSIGVSVPLTSAGSTEIGHDAPNTPTLVAHDHPGALDDRLPSPEPSTSVPQQSEELLVLATAQMGPYTTFQQLGFAPKFPLASIADEYVIPPTYPDFVQYKAEHEGENPTDGIPVDLSQTQFSPPGLPVPTPTAPSKWFYKDPKNVVHGPWKASLMQAWYKDGLLPPDLPVRREEDAEYMQLKDVRLQSIDPTQPFRAVAPALTTELPVPTQNVIQGTALLSPISLLSQPKHFGPPALFFSSRGGHSTSIVDARGRSVLKGRFFWTNDDDSAQAAPTGRMGDIKRLEAFDVSERSVLVAMRQGGLEVVDLGDALLKPADDSRTVLPNYSPPITSISRRAPYIWKIGTPISPTSSQSTASVNKGKSTFGPTSKKSSVSATKLAAGRIDSYSEFDMDPQDEVLFLGRKEDEVYFCEKNSASFRILRLSPTYTS